MYLQSHIYKNIPVSFDFITTWNQGVFLCSPCTVTSLRIVVSEPRSEPDISEYLAEILLTRTLWMLKLYNTCGSNLGSGWHTKLLELILCLLQSHTGTQWVTDSRRMVCTDKLKAENTHPQRCHAVSIGKVSPTTRRSCITIYLRNIVWFTYLTVNTLHRGDK